MKIGIVISILFAVSNAFASSSDYLTGQMLDAAQPFINIPFENDPGQAMTRDGFTVYRPNHGLVQGARVAALEQDVMSTVLASSQKSELQTWIKTHMSKDPEFMKKMALAGVMHRSGRMDESDSITDPNKRGKELAGSVAKFLKAAAASGLHFTPQELKDFSEGIRMDGGQSSSSDDQNNMSRIIRAAHVFDLIRLGWERKDDIPELVPELSEADTTKLFQNARRYIQLTSASDRGPLFFKLSKDTAALASTLNSAVNGSSPASAGAVASTANCDVSAAVGTGAYQSVVKIEYVASGAPAVRFVRVKTSSSHSTDEELFNATKSLSSSLSGAKKTVVHGPTKDDLSSLVSPAACQGWAKAQSAGGATGATSNGTK